jgi:NitT/TauT family transport system ATP-binding protein
MLPLELTGQMAKMGVEQLEQNRYDIDQALKTVRLPGFQDRYPEELSSGQLSRVAVAQAMMSQAKILLMDEVFGTLDEANRMEMNLRLRKINCSLMHRTVVFVTHSVEEAVLLGDRVLVFQRLECQVRPESSVVKDISIALSERSNEVRYSDSDFHKQKQDLEETLLSLEA